MRAGALPVESGREFRYLRDMSLLTRACSVVALGLGLLTSACHGDEKCTEWTGNSTGVIVWSKCGDSRDRKVQCDVPEGASASTQVKCTCYVGDVAGKTFQLEFGTTTARLGSSEPATKTANEQCGWNLTH